MTIYTWSITADENDTADSTINWAEFQDPDTVNNSARAMMARLSEFRDDLIPTRSTTGANNAYLVTAAAAPASFSADFVVWFRADRTNTGSSTLKVNALPAKPLRARSGAGLAPGEIQVGTIVGAYYSLATDEFLIVNSGYHANALLPSMVTAYAVGLKAGMITDWAGPDLPTGYLWCNGDAVSRTEYADLFAAIGTTFGAGNGSTTFNVPDLRGRATFGRGPTGRITPGGSGIDASSLGAAGGVEATFIVRNHLPNVDMTGSTNSAGAHSHTVTLPRGENHGANRMSGAALNTGSFNPFSTSSAGNHSHTVTVNLNGNVTQQALRMMPPAMIMNKIILAKPIAAGGGDIVPTYTVAGLPTAGPNIAIASNGRKNGEGEGSGTGVLAFRVATTWYAVDTGAEVEA